VQSKVNCEYSCSARRFTLFTSYYTRNIYFKFIEFVGMTLIEVIFYDVDIRNKGVGEGVGESERAAGREGGREGGQKDCIKRYYFKIH
jgi:hypothetical protein